MSSRADDARRATDVLKEWTKVFLEDVNPWELADASDVDEILAEGVIEDLVRELTEPPRATKAARKAKRLARPRAKKARLKRAA